MVQAGNEPRFYDDIEDINFNSYLYNHINSVLIRFQGALPVNLLTILGFKQLLNLR